MTKYNAIIVGAGFAGAAAARRLAEEGNMRVLLLERRGHVGGNAFDDIDAAGLPVHRYGPHIFHTNDHRVYQYLSRFTQWLDYSHRVVADVPDGKGGRSRFPVPFNLVSLETVFGPDEGRRLGDRLIAAYGAERKVTILELRRSADPEISALADFVYEKVFLRYTMKQWGTTPEDTDPGTTARVPVFLSRDCRYFQDSWQGMPLKGYTALFRAMLDHPNIELHLNVNAADLLDLRGRELLFDGVPFAGPVIWTGAADELFGCIRGRLPYRTLDFKFETLPIEWFQNCGTVNYTVDEPFTRITEFKHMTDRRAVGVTTILREYSRAYTGAPGEVPCYPIINGENNALYAEYAAMAARFPNLHLLGRLAEYTYYNMDAIVGRALALTDGLLR